MSFGRFLTGPSNEYNFNMKKAPLAKAKKLNTFRRVIRYTLIVLLCLILLILWIVLTILPNIRIHDTV